MHGVAYAFTVSKPDSSTSAPASKLDDWSQANKVCRHTILSALSNDLFDVYCSYKEAKDIWDSMIMKYTMEDSVRQHFIIGNYYRWEMNEEKDIKVQINEYHKLLGDLKLESLSLPDEFVSELLIEKLPESWIDYKQHLKHRHKQTLLTDLITHIIIEDASVLRQRQNHWQQRQMWYKCRTNPIKRGMIKRKISRILRTLTLMLLTPPLRKKGNCFVCGKPGHHAPQCCF
uniref:CCHC-type domain-containing protein n=1 Tax=Cajanus cajan TaxID=3821 RepID=A0A151TRC5_CAJCA|nr:hypothetical protein KK1_008794 [Cajanus cajan]